MKTKRFDWFSISLLVYVTILVSSTVISICTAKQEAW